MLTKKKLDDLWQAGFCKTLIEQLRPTASGAAGSSVRVALIDEHLKLGCVMCKNAHTLKHVERITAELMGAEALQRYQEGEDITKFPGFPEHFKAAFLSGIQAGVIDAALTKWISRTTAKRAGQLYPLREDKDGKKAN